MRRAGTVADFLLGINFFRYDDGMSTPLPVIQCCAPLGSARLSEDEAEELERVFKALGLKQSTTSYHLKQLLDAGILTRQRRGKFAYFAVAPGALERVGELLVSSPVAAFAA